MKNKLFLAICIYAMPFACFAQNNCKDALLQAGKNYESGDFNAVIKQLNPCIGSLDKEEKFEAYRLLTLSHIYLNEKAAADSTMQLMLMKKPSYRTFPNPNEPTEFMKLLKTYEVSPKLLGGIKAGMNYTSVHVTANYMPAQTRSVYEPQLGLQVGAALEYMFSKQFSARLEGVASFWKFKRTLDDVVGWKQVYDESLTYYSLPIIAKYAPLKTKLSPFVQAGYAFNYLSATQASIKATDNTYGNTTLATTNPIERRNRTSHTIIAGGGLSYPFGNAIFFSEANYGFGLSPIVKSDMRYADEEFVFHNQYVDDDLKFDNFSLNLGISLPIIYRVNKVK